MKFVDNIQQVTYWPNDVSGIYVSIKIQLFSGIDRNEADFSDSPITNTC